ncbi:MAG: hypothetical protein KDD40_09190, partial [Bdellovibrionales bacterium]|nr:hypothetical protein [Bdellovibrionales bacterium]
MHNNILGPMIFTFLLGFCLLANAENKEDEKQNTETCATALEWTLKEYYVVQSKTRDVLAAPRAVVKFVREAKRTYGIKVWSPYIYDQSDNKEYQQMLPLDKQNFVEGLSLLDDHYVRRNYSTAYLSNEGILSLEYQYNSGGKQFDMTLSDTYGRIPIVEPDGSIYELVPLLDYSQNELITITDEILNLGPQQTSIKV